MAKFCTKCGKPLDESGICSCKSEAKGENFKVYLQEIADIAKGLIKAPADTAKKCVSEKKFIEGSMMIALCSIILALFVLSCSKILSSLLFQSFGAGGFLLEYETVSNFPYFRIFFVFLISFLIIFFGMAFLLHIVNTKIFKAKGTFKGMVSLVGIATLYYSALGLCSIVFSFISLSLAFLLFMVANMLFTYYLYTGLKYATNAKENNYAYIIVTSYVIGMFLLFIFSKIFS